MSEGVSHSQGILARGNDFLRFLETQGQQLEGLSKTVTQSIYDTQYLTYRCQIHPGEPSIPFNVVLKTLIDNLVLHLQGDILHYVSFQSDSAYAQSTAQSRNPAQYLHENAGASNFHPLQQTFPNFVRPGSSGAAFSHERNDTVFNDRGAKPKKKKHPGNLLAVDQHIIIHRTPTVCKETSEELAAFQASISHLPNYVTLKGQVFDCSPCGAKCTSKGELLRHLDGRRHRLSVITMKLKSERESLILDKGKIQIRADCEGKNGTYFIDLREGVVSTINVTIKNVSPDHMVELVHCEMLKRIRVFTLYDEKDVTEHQNKVTILPDSIYKVRITAMAKNVGNYHTPLGFHFNLDGQEFHIVRFIHARCKSAITDQVKSSKPYKRPPRHSWRREAAEIVEGFPLPKWSGDNLPKKIALERYRIPDSLRKIINHGLKVNLDKYSEIDRSELSSLRSVLEKPLSWESYDKRFSAMNHFEETQMEVDIRKYDMEAVTMRAYQNNRRLLMLEVPGLSENRPSVLRGDWLYVRICTEGSTADREYQGYVHEVRQNEVALGFNKKLMDQYVKGLKFNVRFVFNRLPLRLQHRACSLAKDEGLEDFLFPTERTICSRNMNILPLPLMLYNKDLENNDEQKKAIHNILSGISRPAPYLVFGPPGTGKTVTIVEAMMQIWKHFKKCRILACAPSNSAADLIAIRLLKIIPKNDIMRLNAFSRSWDLIPKDVKAVSNYDHGSGQYYYPGQDAMEGYKIIICTLVTAGRLVSANFPSCHFSHFFVDESGHAVEPECIIPLAGILTTDPQLECGQVVLAGDPEQLGPILRSPFAIEYKLDVSLLQRYMTTCEVYKRTDTAGGTGYDNRIITKLLQNYRSHPAILHLPNQSFYQGELVYSADKGKRETFCRWEGLPKKQFPVIFHGVLGQDEREERSPSFFNAAEVDKVWYYIDLLLQNKGYKLNPKDIGVISPYRKQVQKIQALLKKKSLKDIHVGSVEEFQGQERLVIIVSTVRSNPDYLSLDIQYRLGFLKNPKRFNVTLTRAKALLVVIGNPQTLSHDQHWKSFIDYCKENGGYTGFTCEQEEEEELLELEERLKLMKLWDQEELDKTAEFVQDYGIRNDSAIMRDK
ncbi:putative helicase MOV-10 isoform X2 [Mizuhopecten yessoensis]|uniref:RNA helicase n=2 Tax=Mizuhopecten yessoensis TaxID=6573 RepID=A0A210QWW2_MIZYE|nr:putative helicase MOV-10 isoform X2 [Mizuhopecten yessoensis]XP_021347633.1 putative helicase MOV-10 isoform X2 [Mizuhopecten yessoensis]XP_021347634.1 putative helicase MOV-10 isoform X2 [Mizuhopecten yessoensis]XP_021347635.1 putative helicase MOV-10 isoform X2 [Mizuhopecten yessoensis]OWF53196.1 helicase MOV-10 [Mizuhopecten yessoensis]